MQHRQRWINIALALIIAAVCVGASTLIQKHLNVNLAAATKDSIKITLQNPYIPKTWVGTIVSWFDNPFFLFSAIALLAYMALSNFISKPFVQKIIGSVFPLRPSFLYWPEDMDDPSSPFSEQFSFSGREEAHSALRRFAGAEQSFLWYGIYGDAGMGKTRLAMEWLRQLGTQKNKSRKWDVGVLEYLAYDVKGLFEQIDDWTPRRATAILIDEAGNIDPDTRQMLIQKLADAARRKNRHPVRVLLTDIGPSFAVALPPALGWQEEEDDPTLMRIRANEQPVDYATIGHVAAVTAGQETPDETQIETWKKQAQGNPLVFITLARGESLRSVAEKAIRRAEEMFGTTQGKKMLLLSCMAGPVEHQFRKRVAPDAGDRRQLLNFFPGRRTDIREFLPAFKPELVAQEMVPMILNDLTVADSEETVRTAFEANIITARRFVRNLRDNMIDGLPEMLQTEYLASLTDEAHTSALEQIQQTFERIMTTQDDLRMEELTATLIDLTADWPEDNTIQSLNFRGTQHIARYHLEKEHWPVLIEQLEKLVQITVHFPESLETHTSCIYDLQNAQYVAFVKDKYKYIHMIDRLIARIAYSFASEAGVQYMHLVSILRVYKTQLLNQEWEKLADTANRLKDIVVHFPDDESIQYQHAMMITYMMQASLEQKEWEHLIPLKKQLTEIAKQFPNNRDIQLVRFMGLALILNCVLIAVLSLDPSELNEEIEELRRAFPEDININHNYVTAKGEMVKYYEMTGDYNKFDTILQDINTVREQFNHELIDFAYLCTINNMQHAFGDHNQWDNMKRIEQLITDAAEEYPDNPQFQYQLAKSSVCASKHYRDGQMWDQMQIACIRLERTASRPEFLQNKDIQIMRFFGNYDIIITAHRYDLTLTKYKAEGYDPFTICQTVFNNFQGVFLNDPKLLQYVSNIGLVAPEHSSV